MIENFFFDIRYVKVIVVENNILLSRFLNVVRLLKVFWFFVGFFLDYGNVVFYLVFNLVCFFYINLDVITIFLLL